MTEAIHGRERGAGQLKVTRTRSGGVYEELRRDIVRCHWRPGARLRFEELKTAYDVGLSPLREALMKLQAGGLVELEEHKGFRVAPVSRAALLDITNMRKELEAMAIRQSIANGDDRWEAGIVGALHELAKRSKIGADGLVDDEWEQRHHAFHDALAAACRSEWLVRFRDQLYDQADRYRRLAVQYLRAPRDDLGEHRELAAAVIARDTESATYLARRHLDRTCQILLSGEPKMFVDA
ncbi:FCD domain-containing protein [Phreatobacter stygius]|uniref:FCD domain-containing protein n=1 Tax=Phreatobacter stygius TaxID=1940610 RepID=A0A4D7AX36_9HYPH|nr:FCD domain-containing protein [Phreatobacter stygius]QCI63398.1 FCD domain-containing protein [Phreatobacter stygius]